MKKLLVIAVAVSILAAGGSAFAQGKVWKDLSWWGKSGATPAPVKDTTKQSDVANCCMNGAAAQANDVRTGYWWWPTSPKANGADKEPWGNRGVVYAQFQPDKPKPPVEEKVKKPDETKAPPVKRVKPVLNNVLFDFDKAILKPEGKAEADKVVADMKAFPKDTLVIEGHTCDIGSDAYNMALGQRRADSVKKYLAEQGIDAARVTAKSFGETKPAVPNKSAADRKLNRRAVFELTIAE